MHLLLLETKNKKMLFAFFSKKYIFYIDFLWAAFQILKKKVESKDEAWENFILVNFFWAYASYSVLWWNIVRFLRFSVFKILKSYRSILFLYEILW